MGRHHARRQDRRDQRQAVGRRRHVPIGETAVSKPRPGSRRCATAGSMNCREAATSTANGWICFPSTIGSVLRSTGRSAAGRRSHSTRGRTAGATVWVRRGRMRERETARQRRIGRGRQLGDGQRVAAEPLEQLACDRNGGRVRAQRSGKRSNSAAACRPNRHGSTVVRPPDVAVSSANFSPRWIGNSASRLSTIVRLSSASSSRRCRRSRAQPWSIVKPAGSTSPMRPPGRTSESDAFSEQLIQVRVSAALQAVAARLAAEPRELRARVVARRPTGDCR